MTTPIYAKCLCGHLKARHEAAGFDGECINDGCHCLSYRPDARAGGPPPVQAARPPALVTPTKSQQPAVVTPRGLIDTGKASMNKSIVAFATRIEADLAKLAEKLRADDGKAALRRQVEQLEAQLARAKAELRLGTGRLGAAETAGSHACTEEGCDRAFSSPQGVATHRRHVHEGWNPTRKAAE